MLVVVFVLLLFCVMSSGNDGNGKELPPLGKTGAYTAACRAYESSKAPNVRLFSDPFASIFAGKEGMNYLNQFCSLSNMDIEDAIRGITERTKFIDDAILSCLQNEFSDDNIDIIQMVMVGVGGDTRSFRIPFPMNKNVIIYEIDLLSVVEYRENVFLQNNIFAAPNVIIKRIGTDLRDKEWVNHLENKGYDKNKKSIWILEGILKYFEHNSTLDILIKSIHSLIKYDSFIIGDVVNNKHIQLTAKPWQGFGGGTMLSGIDVPTRFLQKFGFGDINWKQVGFKENEKEIMLNSTPYQGDHLRRWFAFSAKCKNNHKKEEL